MQKPLKLDSDYFPEIIGQVYDFADISGAKIRFLGKLQVFAVVYEKGGFINLLLSDPAILQPQQGDLYSIHELSVID